jgi:hypothetical protein
LDPRYAKSVHGCAIDRIDLNFFGGREKLSNGWWDGGGVPGVTHAGAEAGEDLHHEIVGGGGVVGEEDGAETARRWGTRFL